MTDRYCAYCGRISRRCECAKPDSPLRRFLAIAAIDYIPQWRATPYKRGVPPQVKRLERATARRHYNMWYAQLVERYGETCQHCGATENLVLDHVQSIAKGGRSEIDNMQVLCATCNATKGKLIYRCHVEDTNTD